MIKETKFTLIAALLIFALAFGAFAPAVQAAGYEAVVETNTDDGDDDAGTIVEVALAANAATGEFSILIAALQAADPAVLETLSGENQHTVFAPTDAAFGDLLAELNLTAEQLLGDQALLTNVLLYHVAKGNLDSEDVLENDKIATLQGDYIYQDDGILTDENGRTVNLVAVDIEASNGVIHVIDRVLLPSSDPQPPVDDDDDDAGTIVEVALAANAATGEFSILIAALQAADPAVLETLSGEKQHTVFAPTDAAFVDLLAELDVTAEQLLGDQALLTNVLLYHVAKGNLDSEDVLENDKIATLQGGYIYQDDGVLTDENGRTVNLVSVDIEASNGVIHVIDRVLLPSSDPQPPVDDDPGTIVEVVIAANAASETNEFSILIAALQAADPAVLETLSGEGQFTVFGPTDAAFVDLLAELNTTAAELLANQALLTQVLLYHVASGNLDSDDVLESDKIATLQGGYIYQDDGILTDENGRTANLVIVDIEASNGVVHVIDRVILPSSDVPNDATFEDVPTTHMFWQHIEALHDAGITVGCSESPKLYCPDAPVTRGEVAVIIERAKGNFSPSPSSTGMFSDLSDPGLKAFTPFIEQFYNDGITAGCSESPLMYCPQNNVTRGEIAVFIERAKGNFAPAPSSTGMFSDLPYPSLEAFTPFIEQFYNDGNTAGCSESPLMYCPQNNVTRGEMAVFIASAFGIAIP